jgi:hypothetical protein
MPNNHKALRCNGLRMLVYDFHGVGFLVWRTQTTFSGPAFEAPAVVAGVLNHVFVVAGPALEMPKREVTIPAKRYQIGRFQFQLRRDVYRYQVMGFKVPIRAACQTIGALKGPVAKSTPPRGPRRPEDHSHGGSKQAVNHAAPAK